ncbi:MAG: hypothetical protein E7271_02935 [Lachnospiraceae bacterium]|jgi:hypothetical protein|nr:hypothetical protein [Lachnospiraceae bacterium]
MKEIGKKILYVFGGIVLIAALIYVLLVQPILALNNKKDLHTVNIDQAGEILTIEHSINGLIPIGKDYYYVGVEKDSENAYIIRAPKKWLNENFGSDFKSLNANGLEFTALAVRVEDFDVRDELANRASQIVGMEYPIGVDYCLEISYKQLATKKLILFALGLIVAVMGIILAIKKERVGTIFSGIFIVMFMVFLFLVVGIVR